ncbi:MAG: chain length determinant family protein [Acidobacteria bacterium]|nr:chain length determinant family protein [Acidobacteriota bacterium]
MTETPTPPMPMIETPAHALLEEYDPVDNTGEVSFLDLLIVAARRKRMIVGVTFGAAIVSLIVSLLLPKEYTATVTLLPPQQNTSMGAALASQLSGMGGMAALAGGGGLGLKNPNDKYVALMKSRTVEDAMVLHYGLMNEYREKYLSLARKAFEAHATVDGSTKDDLIHISIEDRSPQRAAELANGYVDQFRDLSQHLAITEASQRRLFFEQELEKAKNNLATAEESLKQTELTTGVIQPDSQERALIESAASLRAQITAREVQIQGMQTYATGENSQLVQAQQELAGLRAQLAMLGGSADSKGSELIVPKGRVPEAGMEYIRKLRDVKYYETIFDILARQFEVAKLDEAKQGSIIQVVDPAIPPDRKSSPKRALIVIGATVLAFLLSVITAFFQAAFQHLEKDPETSQKLTLLRNTMRAKHTPST